MEAIVKNLLCLFAVEKAVIKLEYSNHSPFSVITDALYNKNIHFFH